MQAGSRWLKCLPGGTVHACAYFTTGLLADGSSWDMLGVSKSCDHTPAPLRSGVEMCLAMRDSSKLIPGKPLIDNSYRSAGFEVSRLKAD